MFTLSILYIIFYLLILLSIFVVTLSQIPVYFLTNTSITTFMVFIQKYKHVKVLYLWLFFCLTGLPPVGLFVVKFNIFFFLLYQTHILSIVMLFFFFFLNMLFYSQLFNSKNYNRSIYQTLTPKVFSIWDKEYRTTYTTYYNTLYVITLLFFLMFSIIFFTDFFIIVNIF